MKTITLHNRDQDHATIKQGAALTINVDSISMWYADRRDYSHDGSIVCFKSETYIEVMESPTEIAEKIAEVTL